MTFRFVATLLLGLVVVGGNVGCASRSDVATVGSTVVKGGQPTTVFLVRHAEKESDGTRDPALNGDGQARARELAGILGDAGVTHLFATEYRRTQDTLAPLASTSGKEVTVVGARESDDQLRVLRRLPGGSVAVVAGHSNTIPALACALAGTVEGLDCASDKPAWNEDEYDNLVLVILAAGEAGPARGVTLRYGF